MKVVVTIEVPEALVKHLGGRDGVIMEIGVVVEAHWDDLLNDLEQDEQP